MYYSRDVGEKFMRRLQKQERCLYTASHCYPNWEIWVKGLHGSQQIPAQRLQQPYPELVADGREPVAESGVRFRNGPAQIQGFCGPYVATADVQVMSTQVEMCSGFKRDDWLLHHVSGLESLNLLVDDAHV